MKNTGWQWYGIKVLIFLAWYAILHFIYEWIPFFLVGVFGGTSESIYQHMKLAFYAYLFTILIEYAIFKKDIENKENFWNTRMLSLLLLPWLEVIIWYVEPMMFGEFGSTAGELIYSFIVLIICVLWLSYFEANVKIEMTKLAKIILIAMIVLMTIGFTVFSFMEPWIDVFHMPEHAH